ncbi:MAG: phenylalanine--tRNA ligase subunit beta [Minisyncoccia bacterium]
MRFRIKDLEKYLIGKKDWKKIAKELNDKSFETIYDGKFLDIDILPNRYSNLASLIGVSKEIAFLTNLKAKEEKFNIKEDKERIEKYVELRIESQKCLNYFGRVVLNLKNSKSPKWLKEFLESYDINSINLLVDLSNFVMIEYGAPLHIFDLDKIYKNSKNIARIIVKEAKEKELFLSLKGEEYKLPKGALLIKDEKKTIALAGIQGSKTAEVDLNTKNIFIEAAVFDPEIIYKISREINLQTDASYRFERKVLAINQLMALERLTYLIKKYCGGRVLKGVLKYGDIEKPKNIVLRLERLYEYSGIKFNKNVLLNILKRLNCKILKSGKDFIYISPPITRNDLNIEEDIIEEILRFYGLDKIKSRLPRLARIGKVNEIFEFEDFIRKTIRKTSATEVLSYSFIDDKDLESFKSLIKKYYKNLVEIINPVSIYYKYYRPFIFINLIKGIRNNLGYLNWLRKKDISIFEIGDVGGINKGIEERLNLGIALTGENSNKLLLKIKGILKFLGESLGFCRFYYPHKEINDEIFELAYDIKLESGVNIGFLGLLSKKILDIYDVDQPIVILEINLNELLKEYNEEKFYQPIPKFPAVLRDLSIIVPEYVNSDEVEKEMYDAVGEILEDVELFDIYMDIKEEYKSLSYHLIFRSPEKTLSNEDVNNLMEKIVKRIVSKFNAEIR